MVANVGKSMINRRACQPADPRHQAHPATSQRTRFHRDKTPEALANGFLYDEGNEDPVEVHTVKIDWLRELVESLDGEPLLVAYEFIEDLRALRRAFGEVPALGGLTPAGQAKRLVEAWKAGALPLLAFHPASAGHGLNLQHGGSRMAWLSPSWSAELTEQAIARIYRPGQTR